VCPAGLENGHSITVSASSGEAPEYAIDLYWLPLGAGGHSVRLNGKVFEAVAARLSHRSTCDLYHSALIVHAPEGRFVIEQAPVKKDGEARGVVAEGPVGSRAAGRVRLFRYEVRRWHDGVISDVDEAVESPKRLSDDADVARRVLALVPEVPSVVWGRDELGAGEMWNSNSLTSWVLVRSGIDAEQVPMPAHGRAPGWHAGIVIARRQAAGSTTKDLGSAARESGRTAER
jgi:hypothetical protein